MDWIDHALNAGLQAMVEGRFNDSNYVKSLFCEMYEREKWEQNAL